MTPTDRLDSSESAPAPVLQNDEERVALDRIKAYHGVDEAEARFILAIHLGRTAGDDIIVDRDGNEILDTPHRPSPTQPDLT